jgi:hypothetical protein
VNSGSRTPVTGGGTDPLPLRDAASIIPGEMLDGARVKVTPDGLRVVGYPGRGCTTYGSTSPVPMGSRVWRFRRLPARPGG